jgi:hypothetical protein
VVCGKGHSILRSEGTEGGAELLLYSFFILALGGLGGYGNAPAALPTVHITEVPTLDSGLAWAGIEKREPIYRTRIQTPDHPALIESLYRLRRPGSCIICAHHWIRLGRVNQGG